MVVLLAVLSFLVVLGASLATPRKGYADLK